MAKRKAQIETEQITQSDTVCKCGSNKRSEYSNKQTQVLNGKTFTWQYCKCLQCGQWRVDKTAI